VRERQAGEGKRLLPTDERDEPGAELFLEPADKIGPRALDRRPPDYRDKRRYDRQGPKEVKDTETHMGTYNHCSIERSGGQGIEKSG
jgi:hypothetical protein